MTSPAAMQVRHLFAFCAFPLLCFVLIELLFFVQTGLWLELELELAPLCSFLMDFKYVFVISGVASSSESGGSGVLWGVFFVFKNGLAFEIPELWFVTVFRAEGGATDGSGVFLAFFCISIICAMVMLSVTRNGVLVGLGV